jgi:hypothetical protein
VDLFRRSTLLEAGAVIMLNQYKYMATQPLVALRGEAADDDHSGHGPFFTLSLILLDFTISLELLLPILKVDPKIEFCGLYTESIF